MKKCSVKRCDRISQTKGMCGSHYQRWRTTGSAQPEKPLPRPKRREQERKRLEAEAAGPPRIIPDVPPQFVSPPAGTVLVPVPVDIAVAMGNRAKAERTPTRAWLARTLQRELSR